MRLNHRGFLLIGIIGGIISTLIIHQLFFNQPRIVTRTITKTIQQPMVIQTKEEEPIKNFIPVCNNSDVKSYMSYKMITSRSSKQYQYIHNYMHVNNQGYLEDEEGYIGVALGSYFGPIGSKYIFTLDSGETLHLIKVEAKADQDTNNGCEQKYDHSVIEFVIDTKVAADYYGRSSNGYINQGNFNRVFKGHITNIEEVK